MWGAWARILNRAPAAVLWTLNDSPEVVKSWSNFGQMVVKSLTKGGGAGTPEVGAWSNFAGAGKGSFSRLRGTPSSTLCLRLFSKICCSYSSRMVL